MIEHFPIFLLLTPLISALVIAFSSLILKTERIQKIIAFVGVSLPFFYLILLFQELSKGVIEYDVGGWAKPYAITLVVDELAFTFVCITSILTFLSFIYSFKYIEGKDRKFYFFFLLMTTGLYGIFLTNDIFNLYVFFELTVISSYILITFGDKKASLIASFKYLIMGNIASLFFLLGIGLLYIKTGLLNIEYLSMHIHEIDTQTQIVIFSLFLGAFGIKAAIIPFHAWLVSAHSTAPSPISAVLSGITVKTGVYIFIRIFALGFTLQNLNEIMIVFGAITALGGVIGALVEWDIKRLLAYHTISQIGFIIVGIGTFSSIGVAGGIYHIVNHAVFKGLLFLCAGAIIYRSGTKDIREHGIGKTMPITLITYIIAALAISGITPFNGSVSKSMIESSVYNYPIIWLILVFASIGTVAHFSKILYYSFMKSPKKYKETTKYQEVPFSMQLSMIVLAFLCILLGVIPNLLLNNLILPATASIVGGYSTIQIKFLDPFLIFKEWIIVALGLLLLKLIIVRSKDIDRLRKLISKFNLNICVFLMIITLVLVLVILKVFNT
ncbi:MAG: complex I subunit 5 family protein [Thermoplasmatota archaeon]|jgi:multicomponent Na+:H+ antiporter subunit D